MLRGNYVLRPLLESAGSLRVLLPYTGLLVCMCNTPSPRLLIRQLMCYTPYKSGSAGSSCVLPVSGSTGSLHVIPPTWENWFTKSVTPLLELLVCRCNTTTWNCWFTRSGSAGSPRWRAGLLSVMPLTQKCWFTTCYLKWNSSPFKTWNSSSLKTWNSSSCHIFNFHHPGPFKILVSQSSLKISLALGYVWACGMYIIG